MIREPIVSGQFYPENKKNLLDLIEKLTPNDKKKISCKGIILPHAGYLYSGKVAITTVNKIIPKKHIIILGPNHTGQGAKFSLWRKSSWRTPLGIVDIDQDLASKILSNPGPIREDYAAHISEHSIEVDLPILSYFFGKFKFVPICCQTSSLEDYENVAKQIYEAIKNPKQEILLVASSDMTHYEDDACARRKDRLAIKPILDLNSLALSNIVEREKISMCGIAPVLILINILKKMGVKKSQVVLYQTSADTTNDPKSVVGYAGIIFQ